MTHFKYLICFLLLCISTKFSFSQETDTASNNPSWKPFYFPLTRDTSNQFPDSLLVNAKLIDYTIGPPCGLFCGCSTLKLKLTKNNSFYKYDNVYVAIPCLGVLSKDLKEKTRWTLYKIPLNYHACYWTGVTANKFDTKELPIYTLTKIDMAK
jgi:hypothetical protein